MNVHKLKDICSLKSTDKHHGMKENVMSYVASVLGMCQVRTVEHQRKHS